jgi:hypothetical protein
MTHRKPSPERIAEAHLATSERGPRLLAAAGGDAEHAARIDRVLDDLNAHSHAPRSSEVIQLPRRPFDRELEEEPDVELLAPAWLRSPIAFVVWAVIGLGLSAVVAALAFGLYSLLALLR